MFAKSRPEFFWTAEKTQDIENLQRNILYDKEGVFRFMLGLDNRNLYFRKERINSLQVVQLLRVKGAIIVPSLVMDKRAELPIC